MNMKNWIGRPSPKSMHQGTGWFGDMNKVYTDIGQNYCVMIRTIQTAWGSVEHAAIRNAQSTDIPWAEKQRIKNEVFGTERLAIEVFPPETQLVNEANMYHIWVLHDGFKLPFNLKEMN